MILFVLLFSAGYLTTTTAATFSDQIEVNGNVTIGMWGSEKADEPKEKETESGKGKTACLQESGEEQTPNENTGENSRLSKDNKLPQEGEKC